jgi:hypothetical protein
LVLGFEHPDDPTYSLMCALPPRLGGLGITPVDSANGAQQRRITFERTCAFVDKHYGHWLPKVGARYAPRGDGAALAEVVNEELLHVAPRVDALSRIARAGKVVVERTNRGMWENLRAKLAEDPATRSTAAFLIGTSTEVGSMWVNAASDPFMGGGNTVQGLAFCEVMCERTLAPFLPVGAEEIFCNCHEQGQPAVSLADCRYHASCCSKNGNVRTNCHDRVKARLYSLIKKASPPGVRVALEPRDLEEGRRPDIVVERLGISTFIDVVISTPISQAALAAGSHEHAGVASAVAEASKRALYAGHPQAHELIPFAVESTGRLGVSARAYINRLAPNVTPHQLRYFYRDISHILATSAGLASSFCRQRGCTVAQIQ